MEQNYRKRAEKFKTHRWRQKVIDFLNRKENHGDRIFALRMLQYLLFSRLENPLLLLDSL